MTTQHEINLVGGRPWGFSLQGGSDHHSILRVGRVTPGSKAHNSGLNDGDVFVSINGQDCKGLKHVEAQQIVKSAGQTLALVVARGNVPIKPGTSTAVKPSPPPQVVPDGTPKAPTTPTTPPSPKPSLPPKPNVTHISTSRSKPAPPSQKAQTQKPPPPRRSANQEEQQSALSRGRGGSNWYKQLMKTLHTQDDTTEVVIPMTGSRTPASELPRKPKPQNQQVSHQKRSQSPPQQQPIPQQQQPSKPPPQQQQQPSQPPSQQQQQQQQPPPQQQRQQPPPQQQQPSQVPTKQPGVQSGSSGIRPTPPAVGSIHPTPPVSSSAGPPPSRTEKKHSPLQQEVEAEYKDAMDMKKMEESRLNELEEQIAADLKDLAESVREQVRSPMVLDPEPEPELVPYQPVIKPEPEPYQLPVSLEPEPEPYQPPVSLEPEPEPYQLPVSLEPEPEPYQPPVSLEPEPEPYQPPVSLEPEPEPYQPPVPSGHHDADNIVKASDNHLQQMHPLIAQEMMKEAHRETSPGRITGDFSSLEQLTAPGRHMPQDGAVQTHRQAEPDPQPLPKEKKHKPPPGEFARALFDFTTDNARELPFKKDDIITLTRTVNDDWLEGELNGACGLIPLAYIEVLSSSEPTLPPPVEFGETVPSARGKFKFEPMSNRELEFDVGDIIKLTRVVNDDWLEGTLQDRKGIFPIAFVEIVHPLPGMTVPEEGGDSQQSTSEPADNTNNLTSPQTTEVEGSEQQTEERGVSISELRESLAGMESQRYQVIYEYEPTNADEVEILENDTVKVYVECDDGWFLGLNERTQKFGTFPGNYVQPLL